MPDSIDPPTVKKTPSWSDAELSGAVRAYIDMLHCELTGIPYSKSAVNEQLRKGVLAGRTKSSVEFRMQNISAALYELKMPIIQGYRPAQNIGSTVKAKMIALLRENGSDTLLDFVPTSDPVALDRQVAALRTQKLATIPSGASHPASVVVTATRYERNPAVKAWVLDVSNGACEGCGIPAPFVGQDGLPFLEVHHLMPLANRGSDTISNAVALCPNCHRRCHYSSDRDEFKLALYSRVSRLVVEVSVD